MEEAVQTLDCCVPWPPEVVAWCCIEVFSGVSQVEL